MKAQQCVKLTSTNRPFGLSIELTPRSKYSRMLFLTSLVTPINFVVNQLNSSKFFWRQIAVRVPARPGRNHPGQADAAAGCGQPPAKRHTKIKGEPQILRAEALRISAQGSRRSAPHALKTPQFAGDHTARDHPFPSRTRKLSLAGPMVLHGQLCGRLGDRRQ